MMHMQVIEVDDLAIQSRIAAFTRAELDADCEASGYEIVIAVNPAFGAEATLRLGGQDIVLGKVEIAFARPFEPASNQATIALPQ